MGYDSVAFPFVLDFSKSPMKIYVEDLDAIPLRNRVRVLRSTDPDPINRLKWSLLVAHYELSAEYVDLSSVSFYEAPSRVTNFHCKYSMAFDEPVHIESGFYVIPGFVNFAINRSGTVKSLIRDRYLKPGIGPYGYPQVPIYDADKGRWRNVGIHILLARTFIDNPIPWDKPIINHKDGDKLNMDLSNLEWVSYLENVNHAVETGLSSDSHKCRVFDHITGIETEYPSLVKAYKAIGSKLSIHRNYFKAGGVVYPELYLGRYEFRIGDDRTEWYYTTPERRFNRPKAVPPFEVKNMRTGEIITSESLSFLAKSIGLNRTLVSNVLYSPDPFQINGYQVREKSSDPWPENPLSYVHKNPDVRIGITNVITGEVSVLESLAKACRFLNADKKTVRKRLETGELLNKWKICKL